MAKKGKFSGYIDFYGSNELIKKLERVSKNFKSDLTEVFLQSAKIPSDDIKSFMIQHAGNHSGKHAYDYYFEPRVSTFKKKHFVGRTEKGQKGFVGGSVKTDDNETIYIQAGYVLPKQGEKDVKGLAALFWDIGAGDRQPRAQFFVYYAINRNYENIKDLQVREIMKLLNGEL